MSVLDASAILALIHREPGAEVVAGALDGARLSAVNLAEVVGKLVDRDVDVRRVRDLLVRTGVTVEPFTADDAELAGALRTIEGGRALSLGDRCCIALAARCEPPNVLTADREWADLELPVEVDLIR